MFGVGSAAHKLAETANQAQTCGVLDERRWFAVHTLPHREFSAAKQLTSQRFELFLPTHWKTIRHSRRFRTARAPYFPRYLFVRMNLARDRWRSVNGTFGVAGLVMGGELPMPVPRGGVERLSASTDATGVIRLPKLRPGEKTRMLTGPFADKIGLFVHADDENRVQLLLEFMGAQVVVRTQTETVVAVG